MPLCSPNPVSAFRTRHEADLAHARLAHRLHGIVDDAVLGGLVGADVHSAIAGTKYAPSLTQDAQGVVDLVSTTANVTAQQKADQKAAAAEQKVAEGKDAASVAAGQAARGLQALPPSVQRRIGGGDPWQQALTDAKGNVEEAKTLLEGRVEAAKREDATAQSTEQTIKANTMPVDANGQPTGHGFDTSKFSTRIKQLMALGIPLNEQDAQEMAQAHSLSARAFAATPEGEAQRKALVTKAFNAPENQVNGQLDFGKYTTSLNAGLVGAAGAAGNLGNPSVDRSAYNQYMQQMLEAAPNYKGQQVADSGHVITPNQTPGRGPTPYTPPEVKPVLAV